MEHSLLKEVTNKLMQTYLSKRIYEAKFWPIFFPLKSVLSLSIQTLIGSAKRPIAADVVSYDTKAPEKKREVVDKLTVDIPAIKISRSLTEQELQDYDQLVRLTANDAVQRQILDLIYNDLDFVVEGVLARYEFLALKALNQQKIKLTNTNNVGIVTEVDIDYQMTAAYKRIIASVSADRLWTYYTTDADKPQPITDIAVVVAAAKAVGITFKYIVMNQSKFTEFQGATQVQNYTRPYSVNSLLYGSGTVIAPTLVEINNMLAARTLPQIITIDSVVRLEDENHSVTSADPFLDNDGADKFVVFLQDLPIGNMLAGPITEESHPVKQVDYAKKENILISKYSETNPVKEWTVAQANAFPSWETIDTVFRLDTESGSATGVEI